MAMAQERKKNKVENDLPAQKGGTPHRRMYNMTPTLHISTSGPYLLFKTSGAM
jgi:hypothetical protein